MLKKILAYAQYIFPVNLYTRLNGKIADIQITWFKNWQIRRFIQKQKVDMRRVLEKDINQYPTFNSFFIRRLDPKFILSSNSLEIGSPAEATITQFGEIKQNTLLQAKNKMFTLQSLLADDKKLAAPFINGSYLILFLQPHNYHRFHMPFAGQLSQTLYVPGKLFAVSFQSQKIVPNLYTRNERYITIFNTDIGKMGIVLIGALSVGRIKTVWLNKPIRHNKIVKENYDHIYLEKNAELGFFQAGSTIILLFEPNKIRWKDNLTINIPTEVAVGQAIGELII
jgi:phosphatidylserine decarboxylase